MECIHLCFVMSKQYEKRKKRKAINKLVPLGVEPKFKVNPSSYSSNRRRLKISGRNN